jgi:hypothetical protein
MKLSNNVDMFWLMKVEFPMHTGPPQVLRHAVEREVAVERGSDAILSVTFCSNPGPSKAIWEWGSMKLEAGYEMGRFTAEKIEKVNHIYVVCFWWLEVEYAFAS